MRGMTIEQQNSEEPLRLDPELQHALNELQDQMAILDMLREPSGDFGLELLLKKHLLLQLKMDGNRNHERAHLHLDYHRTKHMASYAIDNGQLLAGDGSYSSVVQPWIAQHRADLMRVWHGLRGTGANSAIVAQLRNSTL